MSTLCALILTYNESKHLHRCIESLKSVANEIVVVDSFSTDDTAAIATSIGARLYEHVFINHSAQVNWVLNAIAIQSEWILRIDADEYLTPELASELARAISTASPSITGLIYRRGVTFLGQRVRFGGAGGQWVLRCWRTGHARCESRWMDEHMILESGQAQRLRHLVIDDNLNDISWWTRKHIGYAAREAVDLLNLRHRFLVIPNEHKQGVGNAAATKRWIKEKCYSRLPQGVRPALYYLYRMLFQLGILEGPKGWAFHFLQGLWYRTLVDIKIWEVETAMRDQGLEVNDAILTVLDIDISRFKPAE